MTTKTDWWVFWRSLFWDFQKNYWQKRIRWGDKKIRLENVCDWLQYWCLSSSEFTSGSFSSHAFDFLEMFWFLFLKYFYSCKCSFGSFHDSMKVSHFFQGFCLFYNVCLFHFVLLSSLFVFQAELFYWFKLRSSHFPLSTLK